MASLNRVMLIGNLGRDPETRYLPSGGAVCNFSIATTERFKDKQGQQQEKTEWHSIQVYNRLAEIAQQYLRKGSSVYIEGRIQTRKWQDKQTGADRYATEIIGDQMQMLGGKVHGEHQHDEGGGHEQAVEDQAAAPAPVPSARKPAPARSFEEFSDDIPF